MPSLNLQFPPLLGDQVDGLYMILICTPQDIGTGAAYTYADAITEAFDATTDLPYTGGYVSVDYSEVRTPYFDSPFYITPVIVGWHTFHI